MREVEIQATLVRLYILQLTDCPRRRLRQFPLSGFENAISFTYHLRRQEVGRQRPADIPSAGPVADPGRLLCSKSLTYRCLWAFALFNRVALALRVDLVQAPD